MYVMILYFAWEDQSNATMTVVYESLCSYLGKYSYGLNWAKMYSTVMQRNDLKNVTCKQDTVNR